MGDFSIFTLVASADFVVQMVMLLLFLASIFSWSIIFDKLIKLRKQRRNTNVFEQYLCSDKVFEYVYNNLQNEKDSALIRMFIKGKEEFKHLQNAERYDLQVMKEKISNVINTERKCIINELENGVDWLATASSTAPFVGLLGTVWGIMSSFQSIAVTKNTTLAVVAPSIAEALLATAAGLLVAIPAVIFYNHIVVKIEKFSNRLKGLSLSLRQLLLNDQDE